MDIVERTLIALLHEARDDARQAGMAIKTHEGRAVEARAREAEYLATASTVEARLISLGIAVPPDLVRTHAENRLSFRLNEANGQYEAITA